MERHAAPPRVISFVVCREIYTRADSSGTHYTLVGPTSNLCSRSFPSVVSGAAYVEFTAGHGVYHPAFELQDNTEQVVWSFTPEEPFLAYDPLRVNVFATSLLKLSVPAPGRYDLVFFMNGRELTRRQVWFLPP